MKTDNVDYLTVHFFERSKNYSFDEWILLNKLAMQIDYAKHHLERIKEIDQALKTEKMKPLESSKLIMEEAMENECLFVFLNKVAKYIDLLGKRGNELMSRFTSLNNQTANQWVEARNWFEHPQKKFQKKDQKQHGDLGHNMSNGMTSIGGEEFDVLNETPKVLSQIEEALHGMFEKPQLHNKSINFKS
ncbi:MAG: hypothetical protein ACOYUB_01940 [Patescibacteria group bacterium]